MNPSSLIGRGRGMEKQYQDYAIMGLKALKRAARRAVMDAQKKNQKIPIWKDGRIEYINPEIDTEQCAVADRQSAALLGGS